MKILLSADCLYPAQMGGPSNAIYWQAKALTQAGHTVTVVATSCYLPPTVPLDQWLITGLRTGNLHPKSSFLLANQPLLVRLASDSKR